MGHTGHTIVEKILSVHSERDVQPRDFVDVFIDARVARDFGGANVVANLRKFGLGVADPRRTFFTFDCNPTGSDQKYTSNQQICRLFARENKFRVFDIDKGIGTHVAIDQGLIGPGGTLVSTDSHANILGAIGAFGQGMGDVDVAHAFASGTVWFQVPPTVRIDFVGTPSPAASPKDLTLAMLRDLGARGLLSLAAELYGESIEALNLAGRITLASMATEMGGIIALIPPSDEIIEYCKSVGASFQPVFADSDASYLQTISIDVEGLGPLIARPGHPDDVVEVEEVAGRPVDSIVVGSCTNGRFEDLAVVAAMLDGHQIAPNVVLKIVPSTDGVWRRCLDEGLIQIFKKAGALVGNAGCAGCAAGQIGQNGPGEVTISTGNRNYPGKQGRGDVYLASPATAAASAIAGVITTADATVTQPSSRRIEVAQPTQQREITAPQSAPLQLKGRVWVIEHDNIDTDMIFHNQHLGVTDIAEMGQYAFGNLPGFQDFPEKAKPGDIVVAGENFGCGSSRQQAVDCFKCLGVRPVIAKSFGAIYGRNAINAALPILVADLLNVGLKDGDEVEIDLADGTIRLPDGRIVQGQKMSDVQMKIYQSGGLLQGA